MLDQPPLISTLPAMFGLYLFANWTFTLSMIDVSLSTILRNGGKVVASVGWIGSRNERGLLDRCTGLIWRCQVSSGLLTEGVDRRIKGGEEVIRIESADQVVALELRSDRILEFGEYEEGATGVEFLVEVCEHVGGSGVDVGHRLCSDQDPERSWLGGCEAADLVAEGAGVGEEEGCVESEDHEAR